MLAARHDDDDDDERPINNTTYLVGCLNWPRSISLGIFTLDRYLSMDTVNDSLR